MREFEQLLRATVEEIHAKFPARAIQLATVLRPGAPLVVRGRASMQLPDRSGEAKEGVVATIMEAPPDHVERIDSPWEYLSELERAVLRLAWEDGAVDCSRIEHPPLAPGQDPAEPGHGITTAFTLTPYLLEYQGVPLTRAQGHDARELVGEAARGWVQWSYIPNAPRRGRLPPVDLVQFHDLSPGRGHEVIYEMGGPRIRKPTQVLPDWIERKRHYGL